MSYRIEYSEQAKNDLSKIYHYIKDELFAPIAADSTIRHILYEIQALETFPFRYPLSERKREHLLGIRKLTVKNYLVFYLPNQETQTVSVVRVIYSGRDLRRIVIEPEK